jgi:hypothetical protein
MQNKPVAPLAPGRERRKFGRVRVSEPRICQVYLSQSQELWTGQGILANISLGGLYFLCNQPPPLATNDIRYFTLNTLDSAPGMQHMGFRVLVVRTEQRQDDRLQFGLGLKIISDPVYCQYRESDDRDIAWLDKPRLLYQHYHLNQKAHEIIINTPEIRADKIDHIKEYVNKGHYQRKAGKITRGIVKTLLLEDILQRKI